MNKQKNWLILIIIIMAVSGALFVGLNASAQISATWQQICHGRVAIEDHNDSLLVSCFDEEAPTPNPTNTAAATAKPGENAPTPKPGNAGIDPYPAAPQCPSHDNRAYHSLWDAQRGCHYNHTHNDNPHTVDDIFGTDIYQWAGGEISYPWQTFSSAGTENELKHGGYGWLVRRDLPCQSDFSTGCIRAFRVVYHGIGSNHGAYTRYHSYWLEAQVCRKEAANDCGIVRVGGWQDSGDLLVDKITVLDEPESVNRFKLHYSGEHLPDGVGNANFGTWYSSSEQGWGQVTVQFEDMWGLINREGDATELHLFCEELSQCANNGSRVQPHVIGANIRGRYTSLVDPDGDGYADFNGRVDRYGNPVADCTEIGLDCVPLVLEHVSLADTYQFRGDTREYDIYFNGRPSGWIEYPN